MSFGGSIPQDRDGALQVRSARNDLAQSRHIENFLDARIGAEHHELPGRTLSNRSEYGHDETKAGGANRNHISEIGCYLVHPEHADIRQLVLQIFLLLAAREPSVKLKDAELILL